VLCIHTLFEGRSAKTDPAERALTLSLHLILVVLRVDRRHAKLTWCTGKVNPPFQGGQYHSFADSIWADVLPSRKSTNSYDIFCNNAVVSWKTKLSAIIATSSTEAELISAAYCAIEVAFLRKLG
jgi:hypothetical protein